MQCLSPIAAEVGSGFLSPELAHVQVVVEPPASEQFVVLASLDDPPVIDHQNLIRIADRALAVGDDEAGASVWSLRRV